MMKTAAMGLAIALAAGLARGQASLPTSYSGPWSGATLPTGWTQSGLGSDYKSDYDSSGGTAAKFDTTGDYLLIHVGGAPGEVTYYTQANSLSGDYVYKVQESANGSTWTDVRVFNGSSPIAASVAQHTNTLMGTTRYVKFIYVTKASGNVGLDGVRISGPGTPSVTFDPSGAQSVPASNTLTLAVTIGPSGSGMASWGLAPSFAGASSLSGGTFQMTPVGGDVNKTFTLSVVATNSVGGTTGTTTIAVTPYTPPFPVVTFSPAGPYGIMATQTQKLGVAVSPAGSGITGWTLLPSNYAGTAALAGTNFTFATAEADGPATYVLAVTATNVHGTRTGTAEIAVSEYVPAPPPGSVVVDFEDAPNKVDYGMATNTLSGRSWLNSGATSIEANDKKFGTRALRIRANDTHNPIKLSSRTPFSSGIQSITLWYASYGNDGPSKMPQVSIQISTNLETGWITVDTFDTGATNVLTPRHNEINVKEPVYFRLWAPSVGSDERANIDNIVIAPYVTATGYDAFLLQYNATPGDPGTAEGDDLDGDGFTNLQEYTAGTNPYDEAVHP